MLVHHFANENSAPPPDLLRLIERFVILLYDKTSELGNVDEVRKVLFTTKSRTVDRIPPTHGALTKHILRAMHQAVVWSQSLSKTAKIPSPIGWGWEEVKDKLCVKWSAKPIAAGKIKP